MMTKSRLNQVRRTLIKRKLDAFLSTNPANIQYLTGFRTLAASTRDAFALIDQEEVWLLTDSRYLEAVQPLPLVKPMLLDSKQSLNKFIKKTGKSFGWKTLAYEKTDLRVSELELLSEKLSLKLVGTQNLIEKFRQVKSEEEISLVTKAAQVTDQVFQRILPELKPGLQEQEVEAKIRFLSAQLDASGQSFPPIVAAGQHSSIPHHLISSYQLAQEDLVLLDFGAQWSGYCSDMTRTVFLNQPTPKQKEIYNLVLKAQEAAIKGIGPGMTGAQADELARRIINKAGFTKNFSHSLGHSVGIEIHDGFRLAPKSKVVLKPGMIFTIEPGVYFPGEFGIRIEDLVVMENDGVRVLSQSPKNLLVLNSNRA